MFYSPRRRRRWDAPTLVDAIGAAARVGRRRAVIDPCGEPLVFEGNLPQMFLD
jgi:hypothetical protein